MKQLNIIVEVKNIEKEIWEDNTFYHLKDKVLIEYFERNDLITFSNRGLPFNCNNNIKKIIKKNNGKNKSYVIMRELFELDIMKAFDGEYNGISHKENLKEIFEIDKNEKEKHLSKDNLCKNCIRYLFFITES